MADQQNQDQVIVEEGEHIPFHPPQPGNAPMFGGIPQFNQPPPGGNPHFNQHQNPPPHDNPPHNNQPPHFYHQQNQRNNPPLPPARQPMRMFANPNAAANMMGVQLPNTEVNNFDIKSSVIIMVQTNQFSGAPSEDPNAHLRTFDRVCNTFKIGGLSEDAVRLRLFAFSLTGRAQIWIEGLPRNQITTWAQLKEAFLQKFFPPGRTAQLINEIMRFQQRDQETLYEAWERYKDLLKKCPHHGLQEWNIIQSFHGGLHVQHQNEIVTASGGALMNLTYEEAVQLIENLAEHSFSTPRSSMRRVASVQGGDDIQDIKAQLAALTS